MDDSSVERIRAVVAKREAGVQADAAHRRRSGREVTDKHLARERMFATVSGLRLDDLSALLAQSAADRKALDAARGEIERLTKALTELCGNAEICRFLIDVGEDEGKAIVASALFDTIGQAREALALSTRAGGAS